MKAVYSEEDSLLLATTPFPRYANVCGFGSIYQCTGSTPASSWGLSELLRCIGSCLLSVNGISVAALLAEFRCISSAATQAKERRED